MQKQDRQGVRTPVDLERKYDLGAIPRLKKAVKNSELGLNKTNAILETFVIETVKSLKNMQVEIDGEITTHFYDGVPSADVLPEKEWTTEDEKWKHVGDLYYDKNSGKVYQFIQIEEGCAWSELADSNAAEAMALANAAKDTADSKRRIFIDVPFTPYDNGDLWICDQEIYVCQISKSENEVYAEGDFVEATRYTDDTLAVQIGEELRVLRGTVTTVKENADSFKIEIESKVSSIDELQQETIEQLKKVSYEFGTEDFKVAKEGEEIETHISYKGVRVLHDNKEKLVANNEGVKAEDLHATTYLIVGRNSRLEDYQENRTACFWIGG